MALSKYLLRTKAKNVSKVDVFGAALEMHWSLIGAAWPRLLPAMPLHPPVMPGMIKNILFCISNALGIHLVCCTWQKWPYSTGAALELHWSYIGRVWSCMTKVASSHGPAAPLHARNG